MSIREFALYGRIAWRSVGRNRRRTALTLASVVFGTMAMVLFGGLIDGTFLQLREYTIHSRLGHLQVTAPGYREFAALDPEKYSIKNFVELKQELMHIPGVVDVTRRFEFFGLISNGQATVNFAGTGVEADVDARTNTAIKYLAGGPPRPGGALEVSLGVGLARKLQLKVDDDVTLLTTYGNNAPNAVDVTVVGIFESGIEAVDAMAVTVPMESATLLLNVPDSAAHIAVVVLDDTEHTSQAKAAITQMGVNQGWPIEVMSWDVLSPIYSKVVRLFTAVLVFLRTVVILVVVFSITNTITMSVYERFREIGSIRAIGTTRRGVAWLFVLEGAFIGLAGGVIGALLANGPRLVLNGLHLMLPPPPVLTIGVPLYIMFVPAAVLQAIAVAVVLSVFASIFPARRAGRISIVSALRTT
jgi:putative ABC transport system permease protein